MKFTEAFRALGYEVAAPRTDWSAAKDSGVCLSIWSRETRFSPAGCAFDTRVDAQPIAIWNHKPGHTRRLKHLARAVSEFSGAVDVVLVSGVPGAGYEDAHPWVPEKRKAAWIVTFFDPDTGHFAVETRLFG